jgi:hypothetical protein
MREERRARHDLLGSLGQIQLAKAGELEQAAGPLLNRISLFW